jgi:hydrogenase maturation protease
MSRRVLVGGIGNIFFRDDGFGSETARKLAGLPLPPGVTVIDFGIKSVHLAFQLLERFDLIVLVDAVARDGVPGTLYVIEPDPEATRGHSTGPDAHGGDLGEALAMARDLGARPARLLVVGCEPSDVSEGWGLTDSVRAAVPCAAELVLELMGREVATFESRA